MPNIVFECKNPATVADTVAHGVCVKKVRSSFVNLFILGIFAGVYIGFGAELATMVTHDMAGMLGVGFAKFMGGFAFSVGLMLVVIAGAELFTGNNLIMLSVLDGEVGIGGLLRNWLIVYIANFIGSVLLVYIMYGTGLWKTHQYLVGAVALKIANGKVNLSFTEAFTRGILCNWLVCLAVWMSLSARNTVGKIFAIYFPIMAFVASGFEHCVANMYFIPMGLLLKTQSAVVEAAHLAGELGNLNMYGFLVTNELPVTLGNIVGGAFFVATLYWFVYLRGERKAKAK